MYAGTSSSYVKPLQRLPFKNLNHLEQQQQSKHAQGFIVLVHQPTYTYIYIYTYTYTYICMYVCMYVCMYIYMYIYIYIYICMYVCMYVYIYIYIHTIRYDLLLSFCGPTLGTHWEHISNTLVRSDAIYYSPTAVRHGQNKWLNMNREHINKRRRSMCLHSHPPSVCLRERACGVGGFGSRV